MVMLQITGENCIKWAMNFLPQLGEEWISAEDASYMHSLAILQEQLLDFHSMPFERAACSRGENAKPEAFLHIRADSRRGDERNNLPRFTGNRDRFSWTKILGGCDWHWIAAIGDCLLLHFPAEASNFYFIGHAVVVLPPGTRPGWRWRAVSRLFRPVPSWARPFPFPADVCIELSRSSRFQLPQWQ